MCIAVQYGYAFIGPLAVISSNLLQVTMLSVNTNAAPGEVLTSNGLKKGAGGWWLRAKVGGSKWIDFGMDEVAVMDNWMFPKRLFRTKKKK